MSIGTDGLSASDVALLSGNNNRGGGGAWNGEWLIALIVLFMFPMMFGRNGMWGNGGNDGNGGGGVNTSYIPYAIGANGALTRADLCSEFNFNGLENSIRGIQQGICDSTYALNNSINGLGMNMMNGFHGVDNAICNLGFTTQQGFNATQVAMMQGQNALQSQLASCCCDNRVGQMNITNAMERGFCQSNYNDATNTNAIIQNGHSDTDRVLAKLDAMEMSRKDETIAALQAQVNHLNLAASQAQQNNAIGAMISASEATILRRTGAECPTPAYVVQPPTPVNFPTNCCGQFAGWNNNCGGCGC